MIIFAFIISINLCFADNAKKHTPVNSVTVDEITGLKEGAIQYVISLRCDFYLQRREQSPCYKAVEKNIESLNFDILFEKSRSIDIKPFAFVAFKKDLIKLLSEESTTRYLNSLLSAINEFLLGKSPHFNLWQFSLNYYQDKFKASQALAILFQDTSLKKSHLVYLEKARSEGVHPHYEINKNLLHRMIDTLSFTLDSYESLHAQILYPLSMSPDLGRNLYHFYVPMYLSLLLNKSGTPKRFAFLAPFFMGITYESATYEKGFRYLEEDPQKLDYLKDFGTVKDIFGNFSGVYFGLYGRSPSINFEETRVKFDRSMEMGVRSLISTANSVL